MSEPISDLIGTWNLLAAQFEFTGNRERLDLFGPSPVGRLILTKTGDFMTVITSADRVSVADSARLFETMMAYAGRYRIEGDKVVVSCDLSWHPKWVNTEQVRFYELNGPELLLRTPVQTHPLYPDKPGVGLVRWRREGSDQL